MPYEPLTEEEKVYYENQIEKLEQEVEARQKTIAEYRKKLIEGRWVSTLSRLRGK